MNNAHTTNQLSLLRKLCQRAGRPMPADLTRQQASALITELKATAVEPCETSMAERRCTKPEHHHTLGADVLDVLMDGAFDREALALELRRGDWQASSLEERSNDATVDYVLRRLVAEQTIRCRADGRYALVLTEPTAA